MESDDEEFEGVVVSDIVPPLSPDPEIIKDTLSVGADETHNISSPIVRKMTQEEVKQMSFRMLSYIDTRARIHADAADSFTKKQKILFVPSIILSTACTILSFLLSTVAQNDTYMYLEVILGISNIITGALVTLSNALGYQRMEAQHRTTAELYDTIRTRLNLKCMEYNPMFNYDRFFDEIQSQIEENKARCKVMIPNSAEDECEQRTLDTFKRKLRNCYEHQLASANHRKNIRDITVQSLKEERLRIVSDSKNLKEMEEQIHTDN
mgnify:CR=1 FL=1